MAVVLSGVGRKEQQQQHQTHSMAHRLLFGGGVCGGRCDFPCTRQAVEPSRPNSLHFGNIRNRRIFV